MIEYMLKLILQYVDAKCDGDAEKAAELKTTIMALSDAVLELGLSRTEDQ